MYEYFLEVCTPMAHSIRRRKPKINLETHLALIFETITEVRLRNSYALLGYKS